MPQCKIDGCREQAQSYEKRLCITNAKRREERRRKYFAKPLCQYCKTQHTDQTNHLGISECPTCRNERWDREEKQNKKYEIIDELMSCSNLDELKDFIRYNLLEE